jgi:hypothetical protein
MDAQKDAQLGPVGANSAGLERGVPMVLEAESVEPTGLGCS